MSNKKKIVKNINLLLQKFYKKNNNNNYSNQNFITLSEPLYDDKEAIALLTTFLSGNLSQGKKVLEFEKNFAQAIGTKYAIATNSGSSANLISLQALKTLHNIKKNDEVILPASTFATVPMPVLQLGLKPVYVDVDLKTLNISTKEISKAITSKTKIIMPVHTLGMPCDMKEIMQLARTHKLLVFEDCCEAHGASIDKKNVGSWGNISAFSFFVAHNITTIEGGMILTNDKNLYDHCKSLREFGRISQINLKKKRYYSDSYLKNYDKRYVFKNIGYNMRLTELQAALGVVQLKKMSKFNNKRISNANYLLNLISKKLLNFVNTTITPKNYTNTFYTFPILLKKGINRIKVCNFLEKNKIQTRPMMAGCLPDQPGLINQNKRIVGNLKNSRFIKDNCFFIGIHPSVSKPSLRYFVKIMEKFFK